MGKVFEGRFDAGGKRLALVGEPVQRLLHQGAARRRPRLPGAATACPTTTWTWPGCPAASSCRWWRAQLARTGRYGAVVCLGCLIQGDTPHFQLIAAEVTQGHRAGGARDRRPGDLRRHHRRDARAGDRARGHEGGQQGVRRRALRARDDRTWRPGSERVDALAVNGSVTPSCVLNRQPSTHDREPRARAKRAGLVSERACP